MALSVSMKISRRRLSPTGLYLELNLSNRWNVLRSFTTINTSSPLTTVSAECQCYSKTNNVTTISPTGAQTLYAAVKFSSKGQRSPKSNHFWAALSYPSLQKPHCKCQEGMVRFQDDVIEMFLKNNDSLQSVCELERYAPTTVKPKNWLL